MWLQYILVLRNTGGVGGGYLKKDAEYTIRHSIQLIIDILYSSTGIYKSSEPLSSYPLKKLLAKD